MCLGQNDCVDLRSALRDSDHPEQALNTALDEAVYRKPEKHEFEIRERGENPYVQRHMSVTGG